VTSTVARRSEFDVGVGRTMLPLHDEQQLNLSAFSVYWMRRQMGAGSFGENTMAAPAKKASKSKAKKKTAKKKK
jgi:hypothetical protein